MGRLIKTARYAIISKGGHQTREVSMSKRILIGLAALLVLVSVTVLVAVPVLAATPILLFTLLIVVFFVRNQKLLLTLIPYALLYGTIKAVTLSYIYLRYIFRRGVKVTFGPRTIFAR